MSIYVCDMYICILYMFVPCHVFNLHWNAAKIFIVRTNYAMLCPLYTLKHYICLQNILRHVNCLNGVISLQNLASMHLFFFFNSGRCDRFPSQKTPVPGRENRFPDFWIWSAIPSGFWRFSPGTGRFPVPGLRQESGSRRKCKPC